jgi:hypothetical protein
MSTSADIEEGSVHAKRNVTVKLFQGDALPLHCRINADR